MKLVPFLNFGGNCAEAFEFYAKALNGKVIYSMTYGASPAAGEVPASAHSLVMFTHLAADGIELMGADDCRGEFTPPNGMRASLHTEDPAEAERVYAALSEGGELLMPLTETFWSQRFAMFSDRFGTPWMVNCAKPMGPS
ncbi:MAG TPA: VOC family protein [Chthonomonadaceae bacterium]|nr:VOC family protein [Chthonomonadaceae bacterium]